MSDEEEGYEEEVEAEEAPPEEEEAAAEEEGEGEEEPAEEEEEQKVEEKKPSRPRPPPQEEDGEKPLTETERAMMAAKKRHEEEEAARMQDYEAQRAAQREREEEELRQLKEKQEQRKKQREEEEAMMEDRKREEDERRAREEAARLAKAEEKKKRKEQDNKKKQLMFAGQFAEGGGPNFVIAGKGGDKSSVAFDKSGKKAGAEPTLTKEELEEQKKRVLASLVQPLNLDGLDMDGIRKKIKELHARITKLEADRYDLEKRQEHQEYDHKELIERQKQQIRNKALKKGLNPDEVANAKHPPKVAIASKYDRQIDRRSYVERKDLYAKSKALKAKKVFHGSCRPPSEWGRRKDNEELETLRKNFDGHRYQEAVKVDNAKPPMNPVPAKDVPQEDEEEEVAPQPVAAE